MSSYKVVFPVSCGKLYAPGEAIPDGALNDRDTEALLKSGTIELISETVVPAAPEPAPEIVEPEEKAGAITDSVEILEYVNKSDHKGLERIKGIGTATAKAMRSHGKFSSIDELKELINNVDWTQIELT